MALLLVILLLKDCYVTSSPHQLFCTENRESISGRTSFGPQSVPFLSCVLRLSLESFELLLLCHYRAIGGLKLQGTGWVFLGDSHCSV